MDAQALTAGWRSLSLHLMSKAADIAGEHPELANSIRPGLATFLDKVTPSTASEMSERIAESSQLLRRWRMLAH